MARRTACTDEKIKEIAGYIAEGNDKVVAARASGISETAFYKWYRRGEKEIKRIEENPRLKVRKKESPYVQFVLSIDEAVAQSEVLLVSVIREAAFGVESVTQTVRTVTHPLLDGKGDPIRDADGEPILLTDTQRTVQKKVTRYWRAAAWLVERRHHDRWALRKLEQQFGEQEAGTIRLLAEALQEGRGVHEPEHYEEFDQEQEAY